MVNFKLGDKCDKDEIINMTRSWDKEIPVPDRNRTYDLPNTGTHALFEFSQLSGRAPARCLGGHGFDSGRSRNVEYFIFIKLKLLSSLLGFF